MSDIQPVIPTAPATGAPGPPQTPAVAIPPQSPVAADPGQPLGDGGMKALEAERVARRDAEARLKELEPLAAKAAELEKANMSESERLTEALKVATADGARSAAAHIRLDVALDQAPEGMEIATVRALAGRLQGTTREELVADAAVLFAQVGAAVAPVAPVVPAAVGGVPVEALRPGALPITATSSIPEQLVAAQAAGDKDVIAQLKALQFMELKDKTP